MKQKSIYNFGPAGAFLEGPKAAVTFTKSTHKFTDPDADPEEITGLTGDGKKPKFVPWGEDNDTPDYIIEQVYLTPVATAGMQFNIKTLYGLGVKAGTFDDKGKFIETNNKEVLEFFKDNDIKSYFLEQCTDTEFFYNAFPEIILSKDPKNPKIVQLNHKEAAFSRWGEMDKKGSINWHYYSASWTSENEQPKKENVVASKVLDRKRPVADLKSRIEKGLGSSEENKRFIIPLCFPTPGKLYYQKPYWYSLIDSGWLEFAAKIPEFKKSILKNQAAIKYHIELHPEYFEKIFAEEKIETDAAKRTRINKEYENFTEFLTGSENAGKTVISYLHKRNVKDHTEWASMLKITPIESSMKGGEYIEDSEEVSNIISYALNVHPSIIGSSPGKSKNINGTEARELFNIKQALLKPARDMLLKPFYLIKEINGWPEDLEFIVPDLSLTTQDDSKTGIKETIK